MNTPLLALYLNRKRDILLARRQARQIARLLGFDPAEQTAIAAAVFEVAYQARRSSRLATLHFQLDGDLFQVYPVSPRSVGDGLRFERMLPEGGLALTQEDLAWIIQELTRLTPLDSFEEVRHQNQELLRTTLQLQAMQRGPVPAREEYKIAPAA